MRKLLTFLFAALMSVGMFALTPLSGDTWDDATKTLTVNSNLEGYAYLNKTEIEHVIISNSVTSIGDGAFKDCTGLTSVTIPEGVTSIGYLAFYHCSGLPSITIPNSVTSIGYQAFYNCSNLKTVTCVRETPADLGNHVFDDTHANLKIYVPAGSVDTYKAAWSAYEDKIVAIPAPTPTAVENVQTNEVQASKILRDGMLLILRDGKIFNLTGAHPSTYY